MTRYEWQSLDECDGTRLEEARAVEPSLANCLARLGSKTRQERRLLSETGGAATLSVHTEGIIRLMDRYGFRERTRRLLRSQATWAPRRDPGTAG